VSHANLLYIEDLKMKTPNSGTTLHQLGMSHSQNLPMINSGLIGWQRRLDALERNGPGASPSPFRLPNSNSGGGICNQSFVIQSDFNTAKLDIENSFQILKDTVTVLGIGGGIGLDPRFGKALERLGDLEGWVTGEAFAMGSYIFCS
jgi:hypothetical protein